MFCLLMTLGCDITDVLQLKSIFIYVLTYFLFCYKYHNLDLTTTTVKYFMQKLKYAENLLRQSSHTPPPRPTQASTFFVVGEKNHIKTYKYITAR